MKLFVIDIGGTEIKYCTMDDSLAIENSGYIATPGDSLDAFLDAVSQIYAPVRHEVEGIAVSLPGFIDTVNGTQNGSGAVACLRNRPVARLISEKCGCPVHLENDGKAAAVAEMKAGNLMEVTNGAVMILGTAVGGGLIINKQILRGTHFTAGEFSFIATNSTEWTNLSFLEAFTCSTTALLSIYAAIRGTDETIDGREFFARLDHDEAARKALKQFARNIAVQVYNLGKMLDVEKVAIGGGISFQPVLLETIHAEIEELKETFPGKPLGFPAVFPEVVLCKYLSGANLTGAFLSYKYNL